MRAADIVLWLLTTLTQAFVVYLFVAQKPSRKFFFLYLYFLLAVASSITRFIVFSYLGWSSISYFYSYYFGEGLLAIILLMSVFDMSAKLGAISADRRPALLLTGMFFGAMGTLFRVMVSPYHSTRTLITSWVEDNLIVGGVVVLLLWLWKISHDPHDPLAARLVNVLSFYFLLLLFLDLTSVFGPNRYVSTVNQISPMAAAWLPIGCGFAIIPRDTR